MSRVLRPLVYCALDSLRVSFFLLRWQFVVSSKGQSTLTTALQKGHAIGYNNSRHMQIGLRPFQKEKDANHLCCQPYETRRLILLCIGAM
jgi:hypothetical protein